MEKKSNIIMNFLLRALMGTAIIFLVNEFLVSKGIDTKVGINLVNFAVSGIFGVPGVALLYGIGFY